jgi:serine/threonine protein kinase/Tol biopolymer transport system component
MSMIGKTLGNFQITSQLGKGGMGEVYQAKDLKLGRDVAIKVLPDEFAKDADRVARFQREAKLLASLNHPNIAAIHGLEESGGTNFLVLELVEGQTLAEPIKGVPIPVEESLKLALQIAEALEAAHEKGVIHRDLKPANVKVTPDGKVKVLDFGLAKAFAAEQSDLNLSNSPTLSDAATQQGVILGTAAYMSPEQARGKPMDKRTDIWAFGCVLYEMLTGQAAFQGEDVTEILAAVVKSGVNLDLLPANIHSRVREVIIRCLQKEQKKRYRDIGEAEYEIEQALADPDGVLVPPIAAVRCRQRLRQSLPWIAAVFILGLIIAGIAGWNLKPSFLPEPRQVTRFPLDADGITPMTGMAISRDGSRLVYAATKDGIQQLFLRARNQMTATPIQDTNDASYPFFSPDGNWIGFFTGSELKKVSLSGGLSQAICKVGLRAGATWGPDDSIVFASMNSPGLMRVSASGGEPQSLTKSETGPGGHRWPEFLPDGKSLLFTIMKGTAGWQLAVMSMETKIHHVLTDGTDGHFVSGYLVFAREGSLWTAPFDGKRLVLTGKASPVVEGVQVNSGGWAQYALANDGTLAYLPGGPSAYLPGGLTGATLNRLTWVDRQGKKESIAAPFNNYLMPRISPDDGTRLALTVLDSAGNYDIWIWDFARENLMTRLTIDKAADLYPLWTPDGKQIVFFSTRDNSTGIYRESADGSGKVEPLYIGRAGYILPFSWADDGKTLVFMEWTPGKYDIGALSMEGDHEMKPLLQEKYNEVGPQISPDGRWMAYASDESGQYNVYVRPFPEVDKRKWPVSTNSGYNPIWSRDGRELFYFSNDAVMAVAVTKDRDFNPGRPEILFPTSAIREYWDISPDGKRFLMIEAAKSTGAAAGTQAEINIVLNWFEELKEQVPTK